MKNSLKLIFSLIAFCAVICFAVSCPAPVVDDPTVPSESDDLSTEKKNAKLSDSLVLISDYSEGAFFIGKTEVTYAQWYDVYAWAVKNGYSFTTFGCEGGSELFPSGYSGLPSANSNHPVTSVSWFDVIVWCNAASEKEGFVPAYECDDAVIKSSLPFFSSPESKTIIVKSEANGYQLPLEKQWEYAAKGGAATTYSGSDNIDEVAWHGILSTQPVATKKPNGYGLYDMSGNVWEWCFDTTGSYGGRALRGGSFDVDAEYCEVACRFSDNPFNAFNCYGFRVVRPSSK